MVTKVAALLQAAMPFMTMWWWDVSARKMTFGPLLPAVPANCLRILPSLVIGKDEVPKHIGSSNRQ